MYKTLTQAQMAHVLSRTSEHSFAFNIERMNSIYKLPINTAPTLDRLTKPNGDPESASTRQFGFLQTLRDECAEGDEILWKLKLVEHYSITPEQVVEQGWIRTHAQVGFDFLQRMKADFIPPDTKDFGSKPEYSYPKDGGKTFAKLLEFDKLCDTDLVEAKKDVLVDIADWLSDIMVYCRSEGMKYGLTIENVLEAVMGSNFTKLPSNGIPIHDANGKFLKDMSNYVAPEGAIKTILFGLAASHVEPTSLAGLQADSNARLAAAQATIGQPTSGVTVKNGNTPDDVL